MANTLGRPLKLPLHCSCSGPSTEAQWAPEPKGRGWGRASSVKCAAAVFRVRESCQIPLQPREAAEFAGTETSEPGLA